MLGLPFDEVRCGDFVGRFHLREERGGSELKELRPEGYLVRALVSVRFQLDARACVAAVELSMEPALVRHPMLSDLPRELVVSLLESTLSEDEARTELVEGEPSSATGASALAARARRSRLLNPDIPFAAVFGPVEVGAWAGADGNWRVGVRRLDATPWWSRLWPH